MFKQHPSWQILRELELPKILAGTLAACKAVSEPRKSVKIWLRRENKRGLLKSSLAYLGILPAERFTKSHFFNLAHHSQGQISEDLKDLRGIW